VFRIFLRYGKEHEDDYLYEELIKSVDDIIALFISKGWVSPENAAKAQKMVNDMANLAVNTMQLPTKVYIKPNRAMTKAQNLMTGQDWYNKFLEQFRGTPANTIVTLNIDEIINAAQRASGIKGEIE